MQLRAQPGAGSPAPKAVGEGGGGEEILKWRRGGWRVTRSKGQGISDPENRDELKAETTRGRGHSQRGGQFDGTRSVG